MLKSLGGPVFIKGLQKLLDVSKFITIAIIRVIFDRVRYEL